MLQRKPITETGPLRGRLTNMNPYQRELSDCAAKDSAANIINGFLNRFAAPTCIEQALVVSSANAWLEAYEADDFRSPEQKADKSYFPVDPTSALSRFHNKTKTIPKTIPIKHHAHR